MYRHPKVGQKRAASMPMNIDALPVYVHLGIERLKGEHALTFTEIARISALPFDKTWETQLGRHGFIDWDALEPKVLAKFPLRCLPLSNLHRWYDVRVAQRHAELMKIMHEAQAFGEAFAKSGFANSDEAVINAARNVFFDLLRARDEKSRIKAASGLVVLAEVMNGVKANKIKEQKVKVEAGRLVEQKRLTDMRVKKFERETLSAAKKISKGEFGIDDINRLRERVFGLPPIQRA